MINNYDERGNQTEHVIYGNHENIIGKEEYEYDKDGNEVRYTKYDDGVTASYWYEQGYDENGDILIGKEIEYDESGNVIRESYYDMDGNLIRYYENEYDDFGSVTRQAMYEDGILKYEKQMSYVYRYIGNIGAEAADYMYHDMTEDGIEELIINCGGDNLYIIKSDHGILKVICRTVGGNLGTYLVKYNGRTGVCCNFGGHVGSNEEIYYFYDGKGKKEISLSDYQLFPEDGTESRGYSISDNDSFEWRDISTGEYYDVSGTIITITVDWYPLEEPAF